MSNKEKFPREEIEGRGNGDGRWLEYQLQRAFQRWGYRAEMRETVYNLEVDVVARRNKEPREPSDWLLAECKDWESRPVTADVVYRLCMLAFTCRAMPVLCHTTSLTEEARRIARNWEVRVLTLSDLHRGALPAPSVSAPTHDLFDYPAQHTAREGRGTLPLMFHFNTENPFSYVPGFEPADRMHRYRPIEDETEDGATDGGDE